MHINPEKYRLTFFDEAGEHLAELEAALLRLDARPDDGEAVDAAFRAAHTIKGGADLVGVGEVARFGHALETLLDRYRGGRAVPRPALDLLLDAADALDRLVAAARADHPAPPGTDALLARLTVEPAADAPPAAPPTAPAADYTVSVVPHPEALRSGLDPLALIREVLTLGTDGEVRLHATDLPPLADLDPERCYLRWTVRLRTDRPDAVAEVFAFAPEMVSATVELIGRPPVATPMLSVVNHKKLQRRTPDPVRFAAFLAQRGRVSADLALDTLLRLRNARPMIGDLAIETRKLNTEQLMTVLARVDGEKPFGQVAVELGYLTQMDVGELLLLQERRVPPLADALVSGGVLTIELAEAELEAFSHGVTDKAVDAEHLYTEVSLPELPPPPDESLLDENGAMLGEFCGEADEHLEVADRNLLVIDAEPTDAEALNAVYRGFHTIKGVAGMLGLEAVQRLAHEAENLLNMARDGKVVLHGHALDLVFASVDALKRQVSAIRRWAAVRGQLEQDFTLPQLLANLQAAALGTSTAVRTTAAPTPEAAPVRQSPNAPAEPAPEPAARHANDKETVRVDKDRLDKLINTIGELVIAQSMAQEEFDSIARVSGGHSLALPELSKISRDLQELSLSLRMIPLQGTFQKMTRLVRDLSRKLGKPVSLDLHGEETELDKTVVDQLGDPLMHMVRNALDHGLESPDGRTAAGKPAEGRITLRAYHQGGNVYIELTDDGRGLDKDRILKKAIEKGIVTDGQRLTDSEIYALIFAPGFSTAAAVTDVSGRGVGMDVVRRNVEALQGNILIRTVLGKGTTFTIRLPLTLAIMDGLMVGLGGDVYVFPLLSVVESFRPKPADVHTITGRGEAITVRGEVVPLLRLYRLLGRPASVSDPTQALVVLVEDQGKKYAVLVDELLGQMQAVVKSLDANYRRVEGLAGATILGDGRVAMILDIHGLSQLHTVTRGGTEPGGTAADPLDLHGVTL